MKPLIFILLTAIAAEAQSVADVARKERARQAEVTSTRVFTMDHSGSLGEPSKPTVTAQPAQASSPNPGAVDPAQKYAEDVAKTRLRLRQLQDQDASLAIQINAATNQVFAPVTDTSTKAAAETRLMEIQQIQAAVRQELAETRARLQQLETQGPSK